MSCLKVRTDYLEATLGLDKHLEISKKLIPECVTVPGFCCCMPLLYSHLMDSCKYVHKNTLPAAKGTFAPLKSTTDLISYHCTVEFLRATRYMLAYCASRWAYGTFHRTKWQSAVEMTPCCPPPIPLWFSKRSKLPRCWCANRLLSSLSCRLSSRCWAVS